MRAHKFRAHIIGTKEWVYGMPIKDTKTGSWCMVLRFDYMSNTPSLSFQINPETIGEWIGLQDINKNDIYEGDICTYEMRGDDNWILIQGEVKYMVPECPEWFCGKYRFIDDGDEFIINVKNHMVIGSIHD